MNRPLKRTIHESGFRGFCLVSGASIIFIATLFITLIGHQSDFPIAIFLAKVLKLSSSGLFLLFIGVLQLTQFSYLSPRPLYSWHLPAFLFLQLAEASLFLALGANQLIFVTLGSVFGAVALTFSYMRHIQILWTKGSLLPFLFMFASLWGLTTIHNFQSSGITESQTTIIQGVVHAGSNSELLSGALLVLLIALVAVLNTASFQLFKQGQVKFWPVRWLLIFTAFSALADVWGETLSLWQWLGLALSLAYVYLLGSIAWGIKRLVSWYLLMFRQGMDSSQTASYWGHPDGRVLFVNSAFRRLFAIAEDAAPSSMRHPFSHHPLWPQIQQVLHDGNNWSGETTVKDSNGNMLSVKAEFRPVNEIGWNWYQASLIDLQEKNTLLEQRATAEEKLERLSLNLLEKQEEERRYFAKELHDEIGQGLTLLKIQHQLPEPDDQLINHVLAELIDKVRNLSLNLRPAILDDMGLSAALDWLVGRQKKFSQLTIKADIARDIPRFDDKIEITVFRIAQEAFTNIHKYAHAQNVELQCHFNNEQLFLIIKDDGVGFDVDAKLNHAFQSQSLGLVGIQERAYLINGNVFIQSSPDKGTQIELLIPNAR